MERKKILMVAISFGVIFVSLVVYALINYFFFTYGSVRISSSYSDFTFQIDKGGDVIFIEGEVIKLKAGKHTITAKKEDFSEFSTSIEIKRDKTTDLIINFVPAYDDTEYNDLRIPAPSGI